MSNRNPTATLVIDPKKGRIRIYKETLRAIGEPRYIRLLVNPEKMLVVVCGVDSSDSHDCIHKVDLASLHGEDSYELYSKLFVSNLLLLYPESCGLHRGLTCRVSGSVHAASQLAVFNLNTLQVVE